MNKTLDSRPIHFLSSACGGRLLNLNGETLAQGITTDSRLVGPNQLFIALKGDRFDAHEFLPDVFEKGAAAALVNEGKISFLPSGRPYITVKDTREALGKIAKRYREDFDVTMISIAGSNGKTSTKELVAAVLKESFSTLASEGSFNNDIGVPLTLLRLNPGHEVAVLEVGSNHPGELAPLLDMAQPKIGIITSIGREHLEFFGSIDGVIEEEGTLAEKVPDSGTLLINGDSPFAGRLIAKTKANVIKIGFAVGNDVRISAATMSREGMDFTVEFVKTKEIETFHCNFIGRHQVINATYALVVGKELGMGRSEIQNGLDRCVPAKMRLERTQIGGITVINDAYNANADSMAMALETLREFPSTGRKIAILGDMAELGHYSEEAHREVGRNAASAGIDLLIAIGEQSRFLAESARHAGLGRVEHFADLENGAKAALKFLNAGDVLLIKASRSSRMERILPILQEFFQSHSPGG